ncbi:MAG: hypothetical protein J3Q66DRAFT_395822 [Benniella sp.]|nr:MAG: hypothetical protein J3Q66DRAFT_395822 [Benniella sp.]
MIRRVFTGAAGSLEGNVLGLVDESTRFTMHTINRYKLTLEPHQDATLAEIGFLSSQNHTLQQKLRDQETKKEEQKSLLMAEIARQFDGFLKEQPRMQELVISRGTFEQLSLDIRSKAAQEGQALVAKTNTLGSSTEED